MSHEYQVSLVIPVRNALSFIDDLASRVGRALDNDDTVQVLLVDDQSTDGTGKRIDAWSFRHHRRLTVLTGEGRGVAAARNLASRHLSAPFVWFVDADDPWDVEAINGLRQHAGPGVDLVVGNAEKRTADGVAIGMVTDAAQIAELDGAAALDRLLTGVMQGHLWNKLIRTSLLGTHPFPATRAHSDLGGLLGVLSRAGSVRLVPETVYTYLVQPGTILNSKHYRWQDLPDVLEIARHAAEQHALSGSSLRVFEAAAVCLPLQQQSVRRESTLPGVELRAMREYAERHLSWRGLREAQPHLSTQQSLQLLMLAGAPRLYRRLYRRYRRGDRQQQLDQQIT